MSSLPLRPILHHLNADTSWLLQVPVASSSSADADAGEPAPKRRRRRYHNVLIDPWLSGPQSDVASWFSTQWHATPPAYSSIAAVDELAWRAEGVATDAEAIEKGSSLDLVAISHEFTDHCHKETLVTVPKNVPVLAGSKKAAQLIRSWGHFESVQEVAPFGSGAGSGDREKHRAVQVEKMEKEGDALYYHSALVFLFPSTTASLDSSSDEQQPSGEQEREAIIYTPHGVVPSAVSSSRNISVLALLHGTHDVRLTLRQLNLGGHNGLLLHRAIKPKYWIGTHDEIKKAGGLIKWFLRRTVVRLEEALGREGKGGGVTEVEQKEKEEVKFLEIANGERVVLE